MLLKTISNSVENYLNKIHMKIYKNYFELNMGCNTL